MDEESLYVHILNLSAVVAVNGHKPANVGDADYLGGQQIELFRR